MNNNQFTPKVTFSHHPPEEIPAAKMTRNTLLNVFAKAAMPIEQPFQRGTSLPAQKIMQTGPLFQQSHITVETNRRRRKIFDESSSKLQSSVVKERSPKKYLEAFVKMVTPAAVPLPMTDPAAIPEAEVKSTASPFQLPLQQEPKVPLDEKVKAAQSNTEQEDKIYLKVLQKLAVAQLPSKYEPTAGTSAIRSKEQEVAFLKLEVERLKRCQKLSKQNQGLYKRLVDKLRQTSGNPSPVKSTSRTFQRSPPRTQYVRETPIKSLNEAGFSRIGLNNGHTCQQHSPTKINHLNNQRNNPINIREESSPVSPQLKPTSPSFLQNQFDDMFQSLKQQESRHSNTLTFNCSQKGHSHSHHSRIVKQDPQTINKFHNSVMRNLNNTQIIGQTSMTQRLGQINSILSTSIARKQYERSSSKPKTGHWQIEVNSLQFNLNKTLNYRARNNPRLYRH